MKTFPLAPGRMASRRPRRDNWLRALAVVSVFALFGGCAKENQGGGGSGGATGSGGNSGSGGTSSGGMRGSGGSGSGGGGETGGNGSGGATGSGGGQGAGSGGAGSGGNGSGGSDPGGNGSGGTASGGSGAGGAGAGGAGGGAGLTPSAIIIQDNFETATSGGAPSATKWAPYMMSDQAFAPTVDTARAHSLPNATRVSSTSSGSGSFLVPLSGLPVTGNAFYVRVFINWEKDTSAISGHSGFIVASSARDESGTELRLGISSKGPNGVPRMDLNLQNPSDGGGETTRYSNGFTDGGNPADFSGAGFQFKANTWTCLEAFFNGAPAASEFRVWIEGKEITEMHVTDFRGSMNGAPRTTWAPTYKFIKIGANDYDANLGHIWYDDVVVATQPIGCGYVVN